MITKGKYPKTNKAPRQRFNRVLKATASACIVELLPSLLAIIAARNEAILAGQAPFISAEHPL